MTRGNGRQGAKHAEGEETRLAVGAIVRLFDAQGTVQAVPEAER